MSTTPRLLKDLAARAEKDEKANGNGKATNGAPKPLVVTKTPQGPRLTDVAKKVAKKVAVKAPVQVVKAELKAESKMSKARAIYKAMKNKPRQDILAAFIEMGLTKAGAATYLQIIRKG